MVKRLHPTIKAFGFLVATGWLPLAAKTLPVLFLPPPHYRVLRRLGNGGYPYFGGDMNVVVDRALLGHWQLEGLKAGATAILLVPECKHWVCPSSPFAAFAPVNHLQKYAAEAIAVAGPVCAMPTGLCRRVQPSFVSFRRWTRAFDQEHRYSHRSFVLSVSVNDLVAKPSSPMRGIRSILNTGRGRATCPSLKAWNPGAWNPGWYDLPLVPVTVLVPVDSRGQVKMDHLTFTRFGTFRTFGMPEETIGRIVRHWRFKMPSHDARSFELIMNWHLISLKAGQPIPTGVVCRYPAYPARHWQDGIMVRHLQWTLYKGKDHTWWATAARS